MSPGAACSVAAARPSAGQDLSICANRSPTSSRTYCAPHRDLRLQQAANAAISIGADERPLHGAQELFLPDLHPDYAGYVAWRAKLTKARHPGADPRRAGRQLHPTVLAARRVVPRLTGAGQQQRDPARQARLQYHLVPADHARAAHGLLHRLKRQAPRHLDRASIAAPHVIAQGSLARALVAPQVAEIFERTRGRSSRRSST